MNLILECRSNGLDFNGDVAIALIFVWGIEFDLFLVMGSKLTCFCAGGRN